MPEHKRHQCDKDWCTPCRGGLFLCTVCKGAEGDLPTECPGRVMTEQERHAVLHGDLDYKGGEWVDGLL